MKTLFFISFLMISTVTFAQANNSKIASKKQPSKAIFVKYGDIKGESPKSKRKKRTIKIASAEKPYSRGTNPSTNNSKRRRVEILKSNKQGDPNKTNKQ